jgi:hypothetical protein
MIAILDIIKKPRGNFPQNTNPNHKNPKSVLKSLHPYGEDFANNALNPHTQLFAKSSFRLRSIPQEKRVLWT